MLLLGSTLQACPSQCSATGPAAEDDRVQAGQPQLAQKEDPSAEVTLDVTDQEMEACKYQRVESTQQEQRPQQGQGLSVRGVEGSWCG